MFGIFKKHKFKIGDIVICIDDRDWNNGNTTIELIYNKKYKTLDIFNCHGQCLDIGGRFFDKLSHTNCRAGNHSIPGRGIHWAADWRFRKATEQELKEYYKEQEESIKEEINNLIDSEKYEEASVLKKQLEKIK